jgi:NADPH:quinone reductase-like Zn-dependent oxidoreductase
LSPRQSRVDGSIDAPRTRDNGAAAVALDAAFCDFRGQRVQRSDGKPFVAPARPLIFRDVAIRGFWLANWFRSAGLDQITAMYDFLAPLVASGAISSPVAGTYRLAEIAEAVAVASKNRGKVLFTAG